eukprot:5380456-Pyramimonas_sp.AAC.1
MGCANASVQHVHVHPHAPSTAHVSVDGLDAPWVSPPLQRAVVCIDGFKVHGLKHILFGKVHDTG